MLFKWGPAKIMYNTVTIQYNTIQYNSTIQYNTMRYDTICFFQCSFSQLVSNWVENIQNMHWKQEQ